jgi:hypothetical protein
MDVDEAQKVHARILALDPPVDLRGVPVAAELKVFDERTRKPVREAIIVGGASGSLKDEYVGVAKSSGWYSEHDRSIRGRNGPRVATKVALDEEKSAPIYRIHTPGGFQLSPGFIELTKSYSWGGVFLSKDYCTSPNDVSSPTNARSAMHAIAAAFANRANDYSNNAVYLRPLGNDTLLHMRYRINSTAHLVGFSMEMGHPRAELFDEVLSWAVPAFDSPFAYMAYASYLTRLERSLSINLGEERNKTELQIVRKRIQKHLPEAQRAYYEFDDWQLVPETERIEWYDGATSPTPEPAQCLRPPTSARVGPSRWWNTATPTQDEASLRANLKSFPFCAADRTEELKKRLRQDCERNTKAWRAWDPGAYKWHPADGFMPPRAPESIKQHVPSPGDIAPVQIPRTDRGVMGVYAIPSTHAASQPPTCEAQASSRASTMRLRPHFTVQCRQGDPKQCNLNALNAFGDTALMSLARVDMYGVNSYPFSRVPDRAYMSQQTKTDFHPRKYTRYEAIRMVEALLASGADVAPVHPVLDVNVLEVAIDPFFRGSIRSDAKGTWEAQAEIVERLVSAFERNPNANLRSDYLQAVSKLAVAADKEIRPLSHGEKPWPKLDQALIARLQKLASRPETLLCGERVGYPGRSWVQSPPLQLGHQTASPVDL